MNQGLILKIDCPDKQGLVARIAGHVAGHSGNLLEFSQFTDYSNGRFFARLHIDITNLDVTVEDFVAGFAVLGRAIQARWHFRFLPYRMKTALLVTKTDHCLNDILWRTRLGELPLEITSVIANRENLRSNGGTT
jgi:formyltetrahydrofolate deformylase